MAHGPHRLFVSSVGSHYEMTIISQACRSISIGWTHQTKNLVNEKRTRLLKNLVEFRCRHL
jgi:hypothetical protein